MWRPGSRPRGRPRAGRRAWNLLAPQSQLRIGSLERFAEGEAAYNAEGGATFEIQPPTQDAEQLLLFAGAMRPEIERDANWDRGFLVVIGHPEIQSASAGTTMLYVTPLRNGEWRAWIVR